MIKEFGILLDVVCSLLLYHFVLYPKWHNKTAAKKIGYTLFYVYLVCVIFFTLMPISTQLFRTYQGERQVNMRPFIDVFLQYGDFNEQVLLNILLTIPFGLFLPLLKRKRKFLTVVALTCCFSVSIETLQWLFNNGRIADITDVITNTLGGIIGYGVYKVCLIIRQQL